MLCATISPLVAVGSARSRRFRARRSRRHSFAFERHGLHHTRPVAGDDPHLGQHPARRRASRSSTPIARRCSGPSPCCSQNFVRPMARAASHPGDSHRVGFSARLRARRPRRSAARFERCRAQNEPPSLGSPHKKHAPASRRPRNFARSIAARRARHSAQRAPGLQRALHV